MTHRRRVPFILLVALGMVFALATSVLAAGELNIKCEDKAINLANTDKIEVAVKSSGTSSYSTGMVDITFDDDVFDLTHISFNPALAPNNATYLSEDDVDLSTLSDAQLAALGSDEGTPVVTTKGTFRVDFGNDLAEQNFTAKDGDVLFTLTFTVDKDKIKEGKYTIKLDAVASSYLDADGNIIIVDPEDIKDGVISKADFVYGDCNNDGAVNGKDVTLIRRRISGGFDIVVFNEEAADVNKDGNVNGKDVTLIRRFISGGYGVILGE